jgi:hypothetical protein
MPPKFKRDDKVTVDGGPTIYTVLAVHSYGKDVLVSQGPSHSGTWVAIEQVALVRKSAQQ